MTEILKNEMFSFMAIAVVIVLLAIMTKKREADFKEYDKNEDENKES